MFAINPVITYGDDVTPVTTTVDPEVGTAVTVYEETIPEDAVNEIEALVEVMLPEEIFVGGNGIVITVIDDGSLVPEGVIATI